MKEVLYLQKFPNNKINLDTRLGSVYGVNCPFTVNEIIKDFIETLVMKNNICQYRKDTIKWCIQNNPKMVEEDVDNRREFVYCYNDGYVGEQMCLELKEIKNV